MPSWTENKLSFANKDDFLKAKQLLCKLNPHTLEEEVTFENVCPMPESLHIQCSTITMDIDKADNYNEFKEIGYKESLINLFKHDNLTSFEKDLLKDCKTDEEIFNAYKKTINYNKEHYGCTNWYDWSCKNWGTKWDACDSYIDMSFNEISFNTPRCEPYPFFEKLSKKVEDIPFLVMSVDEGSNLPKAKIFLNGKVIYQEEKDPSNLNLIDEFKKEFHLENIYDDSIYKDSDYYDRESDKINSLYDELYESSFKELEYISKQTDKTFVTRNIK